MSQTSGSVISVPGYRALDPVRLVTMRTCRHDDLPFDLGNPSSQADRLLASASQGFVLPLAVEHHVGVGHASPELVAAPKDLVLESVRVDRRTVETTDEVLRRRRLGHRPVKRAMPGIELALVAMATGRGGSEGGVAAELREATAVVRLGRWPPSP